MTRTTRALALSFVAVLGLSACGGDGTDEATTPSPTQGDTTEDTTEDTTDDTDDTETEDTTEDDDNTDEAGAGDSDGTVVLYSGRNEDLIQPVLDQFTAETGITVEVRYGNTAEMASQILEEGDNSPADVFLAQDAGALGAVAREGRFTDVPADTLSMVPTAYQSAEGDWVGLTGRARVLAYNVDAVSEDELPASVNELTEDQWTGRVGIAPTNASFQSFVTAMRVLEGDDAAEQWLAGIAANDPEIRDGNGALLTDVADGVIDSALINHYYLYAKAVEEGIDVEELPVRLHYFGDGDLGGLMNITGIGLLGEQADGDGQALIDYLLSAEGQQYFADETQEYPLVEGVEANSSLPPLDSLGVPEIDLNDLEDLQTTIAMIASSGLL